MELYSVLVTGANRGIGLEFVRQLVSLPKPPEFIFATYRSSEALAALNEIKNSKKGCNVELIKLDVTKQEDIIEARKFIEDAVGERGLTLLINNAGVADAQAFPDLTEENLLFHFKINTVGPIQIFQEMLPLLKKASVYNSAVGGLSVTRAAVLNITSLSGCITNAGITFLQDLAATGYKISKASLNMAMRVIAANVKDQNILVVMMCPGWVKTDMGTKRGQISPEESISSMIKTLSTLNETHHAMYMDRHGRPYLF